MKQEKTALRALINAGIGYDVACSLRRISMQLHSWYERECGTDHGCIERDETTGKTYWLNANTGNRWPVRDMEKGAEKRLAVLMAALPEWLPYQQTNPRGCALYVVRKSDLKPGERLDSVYTRGIAVY